MIDLFEIDIPIIKSLIYVSHTLIEGYLMRYRKLTIIESDSAVVCRIDCEANS